METLGEAEELEDLRLLVASMVRMATDNGDRYELHAVLAGLDLVESMSVPTRRLEIADRNR